MFLVSVKFPLWPYTEINTMSPVFEIDIRAPLALPGTMFSNTVALRSAFQAMATPPEVPPNAVVRAGVKMLR